ncbi:MAG TPA: ATP-binding protein [Azospirillum sp.]|nr:ATP-binding protein [Azospirillum sp.]
MRGLFRLLALLPLLGGVAVAAERPVAEKGVLDLRGWNPATGGVVELSGEWLVSWGRLAGATSALPLPPPDGRTWVTAKLPGVWNGTELPDGRRMEGDGAATYRLQLVLPSATPPLTLKIPSSYSAMRAWVDGRVVASAGSPALDAATEVPGTATRFVALKGGQRVIELALEVSNHFHFEGGFGKAVYLDGNGQLEKAWLHQLMVNGGALVTLAMMTLFIAAFVRQGVSKAAVLLVLLLLDCTMRLACTSGLLDIFFPAMPEAMAYRLEYLPIYLFSPIYFFLLYELFPGCLHRSVGCVMLAVSLLGVLLVLLTEPRVFTRVRDVASLMLILASLYFAWRLTAAAWRRHPGALLLGGGASIFLGTVVHDALMYAHFYESIDLVPYGALGFIFSHALVLGRQVVKALDDVRDLSQELSALNEGLERQVAERTRALSDKSAMLERFLANLSHEVRTPLNAVLGMVRVILRDGPPDPLRERLRVADAAGRHLVTMLDTILDLSRLEAGRMELVPQPVDVVRLVRDVVTLMRSSAEEKGLTLTLDTTDIPNAHYWLDPLRLRQVLLNLLSNAVKFTERGGVDVTLAAHPAEEGVTLVLTVADTGQGIPQAARAVVFEPFYQVETSRMGGTGLGLSIVNGLVELMGGTVVLHDRSGGGSVFLVSVPTRMVAAPVLPARRLAPLSVRVALDVLVVEDAPENQAVMHEYLTPDRHRVVYVDSGEEALARLGDGRFDVVLLDMRLPGMDGLDVARCIRALPDPDAAMVPIIAVTANTSLEDRAQYLDAGVDEVISKPVDPEALLDALARHAPAGAGAAKAADLSPADEERLLDIFAQACREVLAVLEDRSAPPKRLADVAHRLKGSGANYGFVGLSADARVLERVALGVTETGAQGSGERQPSLNEATEALRRRVTAVLRAIDSGEGRVCLP